MFSEILYQHRVSLNAFPNYVCAVAQGPWSTPVAVLAAPWDTNLAGVILVNGSFVGVARQSGMPVYLVTAASWKNSSSYQYHDTRPLFNLPPKISIEDGNVYVFKH